MIKPVSIKSQKSASVPKNDTRRFLSFFTKSCAQLFGALHLNTEVYKLPVHWLFTGSAMSAESTRAAEALGSS